MHRTEATAWPRCRAGAGGQEMSRHRRPGQQWHDPSLQRGQLHRRRDGELHRRRDGELQRGGPAVTQPSTTHWACLCPSTSSEQRGLQHAARSEREAHLDGVRLLSPRGARLVPPGEPLGIRWQQKALLGGAPCMTASSLHVQGLFETLPKLGPNTTPAAQTGPLPPTALPPATPQQGYLVDCVL